MFYKLLINSIRGNLRNIKFDLNSFTKIISSLSILYVLLFVFFLGSNFSSFIQLYKPDSDPINWFNSILIYVLLFGAILIWFLNRRYYGDITSYLHLPIKKNKIIYYILFTSLINFFNLGFILFIIPFSYKNILPVYGMHCFVYYLVGILLILTFVTYSVTILRILKTLYSILVLVPFGIALFIFILQSEFQISIKSISFAFSQNLLQGNLFLMLLTIISIIGFLVANFFLLKKILYRIYLINNGESRIIKRSKIIFFSSSNSLYASLELKLFTRNRRLKGFFITSIGFLFLFYYAFQHTQNDLYFSFLMYLIISGIFGYIFIQYLFSWESSYFDFILSTKFDLNKYLRVKYIIYTILGLLVFLFYLPLVIQKKIDFHLFLTSSLYNLCFGYFFLFYMATYNSTRIDLNRTIFFNMQGYNGIQMIALILILFLPFSMLLLLRRIINVSQSLYVIDILCIFSLLNYKKWLG